MKVLHDGSLETVYKNAVKFKEFGRSPVPRRICLSCMPCGSSIIDSYDKLYLFFLKNLLQRNGDARCCAGVNKTRPAFSGRRIF